MNKSDLKDALAIIVPVIGLITALIGLFTELIKKDIAYIGIAFFIGFLAALLLQLLWLNTNNPRGSFENNKLKIRDIWKAQKKLSGKLYEASKNSRESNKFRDLCGESQEIERAGLIFYATSRKWTRNDLNRLLNENEIDYYDKETLENNL